MDALTSPHGAQLSRLCVCLGGRAPVRARAMLIRSRAPGTRVLIVGASRGAADDLAREVAASVPATFGLQRLSLTQLAAQDRDPRAGGGRV